MRRRWGSSTVGAPSARRAGGRLLAAVLLAASSRPVAAGVCTVPGTHATIQAAIDDPACMVVDLAAQTYEESIHVPRSLTLAGPGGGGAVLQGLAEVVGAGTEVSLVDLEVSNDCPLAALRVLGGAEVIGANLGVEHPAGGACPPSPIFEDGFESGDTSAWTNTVP